MSPPFSSKSATSSLPFLFAFEAKEAEGFRRAISNKLIGGEDSLNDLSQVLINGIFDRLKTILEPVQVHYSNEILSNQIYDLSIILFIINN